MFGLLAAVAVLVAADCARADWQVWTETQTVHILRDAPPGSTKAAQLASARNEWESFQILLRSDAAVKGVRVEPGDLRGPDGAVVRAADARLYRQHQMHITAGTYRNDSFKEGWYPDPLIPFVHPLTGKPLSGARLTAVPFDLPAGETHGFWVDVYVSADAKPGEYRGTYRVTADGGRAAEVPVVLTVWDFALPATPTLETAFGSPADRMRQYYRGLAKAGKEKEPADWAAVETQCAQMMADHRINATPAEALAPEAQADGTFRIPAEQVAAFREFVDRYHVNAFSTPSPAHVVKDPDKEREKLRAWLKAWDQAAAELKRPQVVFYTYLKDEPNDEEAYRFVQKWGKAVRDAKPVVKVMVVEQTWTQNAAWGDLYGAVDIWCPLFSLHKQETAAPRQALGETVWTYTALCQREPTPWWHIDWPLLNYRVPAWIAWRFRMKGLLYWGGMSYWSQTEDPWNEAWTYGHPKEGKGGKGNVFNGEGTLVYPGRAAGYDGIAPSLRLKALRDSVEDYEYLSILERAGRAADAEKVVLPLTESFFKWEKDPAAYEKARAKLAALILAK
jgi:hypothetical protein